MTGRALLALVMAAGGCAGPQTAVEPSPGTVEVARFADARAMSSDGAGRIYVVDSGRLQVFDTLGVRLSGSLHATGLDRLTDAVDIDATNGLEWFIADAAGGRILRVSHDGRLLEDTPLPVDAPGDAIAPTVDGPRGRPLAVAAGPGGVLYAIEDSRGLVLRWDDASRRRVRTIGREGREGAFATPVSLAVAPDGSLAVADPGRGEVLLFDAFGSFVRAIAGPGGARSVSWTTRAGSPTLIVGGPAGVTTNALSGDLLHETDYGLGDDLVDALETRFARWLLTPTRLLRAPRGDAGTR